MFSRAIARHPSSPALLGNRCSCSVFVSSLSPNLIGLCPPSSLSIKQAYLPRFTFHLPPEVPHGLSAPLAQQPLYGRIRPGSQGFTILQYMFPGSGNGTILPQALEQSWSYCDIGIISFSNKTFGIMVHGTSSKASVKLQARSMHLALPFPYRLAFMATLLCTVCCLLFCRFPCSCAVSQAGKPRSS